MNKRVLVTGVNGFVGHHLARELKSAGHEVVGVGYDSTLFDELKDVVDGYTSCDLTSLEDCQKKISLEKIDAVIHLAGLADIGMSFNKPAQFINANTSMTVNILDLIQKSGRDIRCVTVSSGAVYDGDQAMPITEEGAIATESPYAVSKLTTELVVQYYRSREVDCVIVRPFNHVGPGQGPGFLVPDLGYKIKAAKARGRSDISVGNLSTKRDYTDVRDVAKAYTLLATSANKPKSYVYNVCSGESHSGEEILELIKNSMGVTDIKASVDKSLLRPSDVMDIRGDNSRLSDEFGWKPATKLKKTIQDFTDNLN